MKNKKEENEPKEIKMDLPEVKDIPGQENIKPPRIMEMEDITISSADEEGEGILDDVNNNDDFLTDNRSNVSAEEKALLSQSDRPVTEEDKDIRKLALDKVDEEKEADLNEEGDPLDMGEDLDIPGSELDDEDEELGEEDEENNSYSIPD